MKQTTRILSIALMCLFAIACNSDDTNYSPGPCGDGDTFALEGNDYCLFSIIEEGFLCPEELPERTDFDDFTACSQEESNDLPENFEEEVQKLGDYGGNNDVNNPANNFGNNSNNGNPANNLANNSNNAGNNSNNENNEFPDNNAANPANNDVNNVNNNAANNADNNGNPDNNQGNNAQPQTSVAIDGPDNCTNTSNLVPAEYEVLYAGSAYFNFEDANIDRDENFFIFGLQNSRFDDFIAGSDIELGEYSLDADANQVIAIRYYQSSTCGVNVDDFGLYHWDDSLYIETIFNDSSYACDSVCDAEGSAIVLLKIPRFGADGFINCRRVTSQCFLDQ